MCILYTYGHSRFILISPFLLLSHDNFRNDLVAKHTTSLFTYSHLTYAYTFPEVDLPETPCFSVIFKFVLQVIAKANFPTDGKRTGSMVGKVGLTKTCHISVWLTCFVPFQKGCQSPSEKCMPAMRTIEPFFEAKAKFLLHVC